MPRERHRVAGRSSRESIATITIRDLDGEMLARLRVRAALYGRSMEEQARIILRGALAVGSENATGVALIKAIRARIDPLGGIDVALPVRESALESPD